MSGLRIYFGSFFFLTDYIESGISKLLSFFTKIINIYLLLLVWMKFLCCIYLRIANHFESPSTALTTDVEVLVNYYQGTYD